MQKAGFDVRDGDHPIVPINEKSVVLFDIFNLPAFPACHIFKGFVVPIPTLPEL